MNSQLRLTVPLLPDETASSYASRLAQRNKAPNLHKFCADLGLAYQGLRLGGDAALKQLSRLSGAPFEALRLQTIAYVGHRHYQLRNVTARRMFQTRCLFRFCPKCLEEDEQGTNGTVPYARNFWELEGLRCCARHKCFLVELNSAGSVDFVNLYKDYFMGQEIPKENLVKPSDLLLENYLRERIDKLQTGMWFDDIPIHAVKAFCEYFGVLTLFGPRTRRSNLSQLDWLRAGAHGFAQLCKGKKCFYDVAETLKSPNAFAVDRRRDDFGVFADWLHDQKKNSEYAFARDLFRAFIVDTYPLAAGISIYGVALKKRRLHSILSAIEEADLNKSIFHAYLVENGYARRIDGYYRVIQTKQILVTDIPVMKVEMTKLLRAGQAAEQLNLTSRQLRVLKDEGIIKSLDGGSKGFPLYHFDELNAFVDKLKKVSRPVAVVPSEAISFAKAAVRLSVPLHVLLKRIITQDIRSVIYRVGACSLNELYLKNDHLKQLFPNGIDQGVLLCDVSEKLALNRTAIACLIRMRVFMVIQKAEPIGCVQRKSICSKSVEKFDSEFVSLKKFCAEQGVSVMSAACKIKKVGMLPLCKGKAVSKIYRRSEINEICCPCMKTTDVDLDLLSL